MTVGHSNSPSASVGEQRARSALEYASSVPPTPRVILPHPLQPFPYAHQCPYACPPADPHSGAHFPPGSSPYSLPYGPHGIVYGYPPPPSSFGYPSLYPSAPQQVVPKRRQQVKTACTNCAAACKKCDEARPCDRCVKYNIADACVSAVRKERKKGVKRGKRPYKKKEKAVTEPKATEPASPTQTAPVASGSPAPTFNGEVHSPPEYSPPPTFTSGVPPPARYFPPPPGQPYPYWYPPPPSHYIPAPWLSDARDGRPPAQAPLPYPYYHPPLHTAYPPYPLYYSLPYPPPPGSVPVSASPSPAATSVSPGSVASAPPTPPSAERGTEEKQVYAREGIPPVAAKRKIIVWDEHPGPQPAAKRSRCADHAAAI